MSPDQLHHKRKARESEELQRRSQKRAAHDRVLIVTEGKRTEPNYFAALRGVLDLSSHLVVVEPSSGSAPITVVQCALDKFAKDPDFNDVFCVFDHDDQPTFQDALDLAQANQQLTMEDGEDARLHAIPSIPCFEFWLLLHFQNTSRQYTRAGSLSPCDQVVRDLRQKGRLPDYKKTDRFKWLTKKLLDTACKNARQGEKQAPKGGCPVPTKMHKLVDRLKSL